MKRALIFLGHFVVWLASLVAFVLMARFAWDSLGIFRPPGLAGLIAGLVHGATISTWLINRCETRIRALRG